MKNYYCLVAGLPDLSLDDGKLNYTIERFKSEIYPELSESDKRIIDLFFLQFDNNNLIKLLKDKDAKLCSDANFTSDEMLSLISSVKDGDKADKMFPQYFAAFVEEYLLKTEDVNNAADELASLYYSYAIRSKNKFISEWYDFNLNINNILSAFQARKYDIEIASVIVGNNDISEKLRSSNARDFGIGDILPYFEQILRISEIENLIDRERKIDLMKWEWLENAIFFNYFSVERIFAFLVKIEMINRWNSLDREKGKELFRKLIDSLKDDVSIPDEFK